MATLVVPQRSRLSANRDPTKADAGQGQPGKVRAAAGAPRSLQPAAEPVALPSDDLGGGHRAGAIFESLMELKAGDDMAHFKLKRRNTSSPGRRTASRIGTPPSVRRPADSGRFSGIVLAEAMHPRGNAWMFHFTHRYSMTSGHIGLDILTSTHVPFVEFNQERYKDLQVGQGQASEILAQVGALVKSNQSGNPLAGLPLRKMILAGTSASAGVLVNYLPAHMVLRLPDMKPIYDGFLPTSNGATIRQIDVPMIQVPTMTEVMGGNATARQDGDEPGNQFRVTSSPAWRTSIRATPRLLPEPVQIADQQISDGRACRSR